MSIVSFFLKRLWKLLSRRIEETLNPSLIRVDDFRNARSLARKLQNPKDPMSDHIRRTFEPEDRDRLKAYVASPESNRKFPRYLSALLNVLLKGPSLYSEERFSKKDLSEETISLLDRRPTGKDIIRLNRLLLEETYPREIARSYLPLRFKLALAMLPFIAFIGVLCWAQRLSEYIASWNRDTSKYGFEDPSKSVGWTVANDPERGFALSSLGINTLYKTKGNASMSVHVELDGTEEGRKANRQQGEVSVDPTINKPVGYASPMQYLDLSNKTLTASLILPTDRLVGKKPNQPIYAQLFLESCGASSRRFDSTERNITAAGQLDMVYRTDNSTNRICRIGIKIGLNSEDDNVYTGDIYIDVVDW